MHKAVISIVLGFAISLCLVGCGSGEKDASDQGKVSASQSSQPAKDLIKSEDITMLVENGLVDGNRRVLFSFTNESQYEITELEMRYSIKPDTTLEQFQSAFADLGKTFEQAFTAVDDDNLSAVTLNAKNTFPIEPNESSSQSPITIGSIYITSMDQFDLFEQSVLVISYLYDGFIYEESYDFQNGSFTLSDEIIDVNQWADGELGNVIPRPQNTMIIETDEDADSFSFKTTGTTEEEYMSYVQSCKEMGFTDILIDNRDIRFYANSEDGVYQIDVTPSFPYEGNMNVRVKKN